MAFRTQKISQMTPKGANLEATDLIEVSTIESGSYVTRSITGQEIIDAAVGNVDWGDIGGTLSAQTDLQTALNAKQNTLSLTTTGDNGASTLVGSTLNVPNYSLSGLGGVPTSRTLTINGVTQDLSANRTFTISTGITIGSTAITSGTVGRILFEGAGNVVQESSSLFWDATNNRLGIGTSAPAYVLDVNANNAYFGLNRNSGGSGPALFFFRLSGAGGANVGIAGSANDQLPSSVDNDLFLRTNGYNILFGTTGTTWGKFFTTGNLGIGTTTDAGFRLDVNGTARVQGNTTISLNQNAATELNVSNTNNSASSQTLIRISSSSGSGLLGRYSASTTPYKTLAANDTFFYSAGTSDMSLLNDFASGRIKFTAGGSSTAQMTLFSTGNLGINTTTDAGFRLDVNGTARVQSTTTIGTSAFSSSSNLLTLISDQGSFSMRVGGGSQLLCSAGITSSTFQSNDFVQCVRVLVGSSARLNGGTLDWLSITNWAQSSLGSGNVSANLATFGTAYATINASAQVEIASTTKGFLPPRMTTTQKNAIASPAAGLMVYDTTLNVISYYNGTMWI